VWGRGYATEGSRALIDLAFGTPALAVGRVFATTMAVNAGSRRVMEKAGLRFVRLFHQDWPDRIEGDHGDVEYALTRAEWEQAHTASGELARIAAPAGGQQVPSTARPTEIESSRHDGACRCDTSAGA
jgi:Acetyltransferase (GNAT) domain